MQSPAHLLTYLGFDVFPQQLQTQEAVLNNQKVAIRGCHSSGKTFFMAGVAVWWVLRNNPALVLTTAPTFEQVTKIMWGEINKLVPMVQEKLGLKLKLPDKSQWQLEPKRQVLGRSTNRAVQLQGYHSENMLLIIDEAPGLEEDLWGAIDGITASGRTRIVMLGNPTISSGMFYEASNFRQGWKTVAFNALRDNPNVLTLPLGEWREKDIPPGLGDEELGRLATLVQMEDDDPELDADVTHHMTNRRWIRDRWMDWGRRGDPQWYSRVLGEFPPENADSLISRGHLDEARREPEMEIEEAEGIEWGVDVAGSGQNDTVVAARSGDDMLGIWAFPHKDARRAVLQLLLPYLNQTSVVRIDMAGMGEYFVNWIAEEIAKSGLPVEVLGVNVGRSSSDQNKVNYLLRMELSWNLKTRFERGRIRGVTDEKLRRELLSLVWSVNDRGVREMESKRKMKERGVPSPDRADALTLAYADLTTFDVQANQSILYEAEPDFIIAPY